MAENKNHSLGGDGKEWTAFWSLADREVRRLLRVWKQTLVPPIITSLLYILIFGYSLGSRITEIGGVSYLSFIFPGLIIMGVISASYANSSASLYISKFAGNIQELLVAPISYMSIIGAICLSCLVRGVIVALGTIFIGSFFAGLTISNIFVIVTVMVLTSLLFGLAGIVTALWAQSFDQMNVFAVFVVTPLTYLGGVFYSIDMLPSFWKTVSLFNPIYYIVDAFRYGFLGISYSPVWISLLVLLGLTTLFFFWATYLFRIGYNVRS